MKNKNESSSISASWLCSVSAVVIAFVGVPAEPAVAGSLTNVQVNASFDGPFSSNKQNEPSLAQNPIPTRSGNLIVGANDFRGMPACKDATPSTPSSCPIKPGTAAAGYYASFDGGVTWTCEGRIDLSAFAEYSYGDPALTFDSKGNAYYATLAFPNDAVPGAAPSDLFVAKSTNGGCTYTSVTKASGNSQGIFDDKPAIAADTNSDTDSAFSNNIYAVWTKLPNASNGDQILFARSTDGGATWSKPVQISPANAPGVKTRSGAAVQVGPDGTVYVIWFDTKGTPSIQMTISRDGGNTFLPQGQNITIAAVTDDRQLLSGTSFRSGRVFPSFTIAGNGTLHVVWSNHTNNHASVMATRSTDGGRTWSTPIVAGDVSGRSAFFASVTADPSNNNKVNVIFQALDDKPTKTIPGAGVVYYDTYFAQSADGGTTFGKPVLFSTASSDPDGSSLNGLGAQFLGDYMTAVTDSRGGRIFAVWTDARNATPCAAVDAYRLAPPGTVPKPNVIADCPIKFGNTDIFFGAMDY